MGYQFLHLESYARHGSKQHGQPRKWSAREIAAESMREPDACPHVAQPPSRPRCCTAARQPRPPSWPTIGPTAARTPRGASCGPMASRWPLGWCPCPLSSARTGPAFGEATVAWLREQYGERLRSVVEHTDEPTHACTSTPCPCRGSGSRFCTQGGRPPPKRPARGQEGHTERRIQAGNGGVAG